MFQSIYVSILELETNQIQFPKENFLSMSLKGQTLCNQFCKTNKRKTIFFRSLNILQLQTLLNFFDNNFEDTNWISLLRSSTNQTTKSGWRKIPERWYNSHNTYTTVIFLSKKTTMLQKRTSLQLTCENNKCYSSEPVYS